MLSLDWVLPVLIEGQVEISLRGAVRKGEGRARCFGLLSVVYNLIWFEFGMHPRVGHSLSKCVGPSLLSHSITNNKWLAELQKADFYVKHLHILKFLMLSHHVEN